jgi:tripartite-type tricarboxylate transporter receptor subunit TctC
MIVRLLTFAVTLLWAASSAAQSFPSKVVRIIVPFPAGGPTDVIARAVSQGVTKTWGQPVVVENRPGADTIVGAEFVARAAPDGHTLLLASGSTLTLNQFVYAKLPYDPERDFAPVINLVRSAPLFVGSAKLNADTFQQFVEHAKARPGEVTYGYFAPAEHMLTNELSSRLGIKLNAIPYKGAGDLFPALMAGHIDVALMSVGGALTHVRSGKLKAYAYAGGRRAEVLPNLPTLSELAGSGMESGTSFGLAAPGRTPRPVVDKIAADVLGVTGTPEFIKQFVSGVGLEPLNLGPDQYTEYLKKERAFYAARVKSMDLKPR